MIEWTKLPIPECFTQDPDLVYIVPHDNGSKILFNGEECFVENATIGDIIDKFNAIGCTSFQLSKEDIEYIMENSNEHNDPTGPKGAIGICPNCGKSGNITWNPKTDVSSCTCGWKG